MADYLGQALLNVDVLPVRAAYLVRAGNAADFRAAISEASTRWGGMQEPILPVSRTGRLQPWFRQLHDLLRPNLLAEIAPLTDAARQRITADLGKAPVKLASLAHRVSSGCHQLCAYRPEELQALHLAVPANHSLVSLAAGGVLPVDDQPEWEQLGVDVGVNVPDSVIATRQLQQNPVPQTTPIASTIHRCAEVLAQSPLGGVALLWVSQPNSFRDVLWFWNLRALALRGFNYAPVAIITPGMADDQTFGQVLHRTLLDKVRSEPDVMLCSLSVNEPELATVREALGLQLFTTTRHSVQPRRPPRDRDLTTDPLTAAVNADPRMHLVGERVAGMRHNVQLQLFRPETALRIDHPIQFTPGLQLSGSVRLRLSGPDQLVAPPLPAVARLYHQAADWGPSQLNPRGLEITVGLALNYNFSLGLPTPAEILTAALAERSISFVPSSSGRYARGVQNRVPEIQLFRDPDVLTVTGKLTSPRSKDLTRALEQLIPQGAKPDDIATALQALVARQHDARTLDDLRSRTGLPRARVAIALDRLVNAGMAARGLRADCAICQLRTFMPLPRAAQIPTCDGCGSQAGYASTTRNEPTLFYQLNTLLDQASANGVLGHLFGAATVLADHPDAYLLLGANLTYDGLQQETDLLGVQGTTVLAGEAKTTAGWFTPEQIAKDVKISQRLQATTHLMVCLEELPQSTVDLAQRACNDAGLELRTIDPSR